MFLPFRLRPRGFTSIVLVVVAFVGAVVVAVAGTVTGRYGYGCSYNVGCASLVFCFVFDVFRGTPPHSHSRLPSGTTVRVS